MFLNRPRSPLQIEFYDLSEDWQWIVPLKKKLQTSSEQKIYLLLKDETLAW